MWVKLFSVLVKLEVGFMSFLFKGGTYAETLSKQFRSAALIMTNLSINIPKEIL